MVRKDPCGKDPFEQRSEGGEGAAMRADGRRVVQAEETKAPWLERAWWVQGTTRRPVWLECSEWADKRKVTGIDGREPCGLQRGHRLLLLSLLFFMKVKEESEKVGLKLNIQRTKSMAFSAITSWQIDGETMETVTDFILGALQNHCRWWLQPWH